MTLRIGTRGSDLALWQARFVARALESDGVAVEIVVLETRGDRIDDVPLQAVEGKAFFTAEIEQALHERRVDVAVHSHKDLPTENPPGLTIASVPARGPVQERLLVRAEVHAPARALLPLAAGARVGTSSPRRQAQLQALRPDLEILHLRGNVPTRVQRLREGRYDAILLAAAGIERLALDTSGLVTCDLPVDAVIPAPAQGALAIQVRDRDVALLTRCRRILHDEGTAQAVQAERRLLELAGGGCNLALGAAVARHEGGWRAHVFRGPDAGDPARAPRWARADGPDPARAAERALAAAAGDASTGVGPLAGLQVTLLGSEGGGSRLAARLETLGARVAHRTVLAYEALPADGLAEALGSLRPGDAVAVTSARAAQALAGLALPEGVRLGAVGSATSRALEGHGLSVDVVGARGARELGRLLAPAAGACVLHPCAEGALHELQAGLAGSGAEVRRVPVYRTVACTDAFEEAPVPAGARVYLSPSAARAGLEFEQGLDAASDAHGPRVGLGPTTAEAFAAGGLEAFAPATGGDLEAIVEHLVQRTHPEVTR